MFNVTVLKMKDIKKYFIGMLATIVVVIVASKCLPRPTKEGKMVQKVLAENSMLECLGQTVTTMSSTQEQNEEITESEEEIEEENLLQGILKTQISSMQGIENIEDKEKEKQKQENTKEEPQEKEQEENNPKTELAQTGLATQVMTNNPIKESYNVQYGKVKIKNETDYTLTEDMLAPNITIENKNIVLFHTHSCESYTSSDSFPYTPTGTFRTVDLNFSVTRVGTELENQRFEMFLLVYRENYH